MGKICGILLASARGRTVFPNEQGELMARLISFLIAVVMFSYAGCMMIIAMAGRAV